MNSELPCSGGAHPAATARTTRAGGQKTTAGKHARVNLVCILLAAAYLCGCGAAPAAPAPAPVATLTPRPRRDTPTPTTSPTPTETSTPAPTDTPTATPTPAPFVPALPGVAELDQHGPPVDVPLELRIPSLKVSAAVSGVGLIAAGSMDAPEGPPNDPVWQKVFWYRGSAVPGANSTATIAGHVDDTLGRPAVFARLKDVHPGDLIFVHDTRTGRDVRFVARSTQSYTTQQASLPAVLALVYGSGPMAGRGPQPEADGQAHLTLITCAGVFTGGEYNRRLVVYATRAGN